MRFMLKLALALPLAALFFASPASAQFVMGWGWETYVDLTGADLEMIKTALETRVHNHQSGTVAAWSNPQSGNSGTLKLLNTGQRDGRRCEQIEYRNKSPRPNAPYDHFVLTSCIQADGTWRLS